MRSSRLQAPTAVAGRSTFQANGSTPSSFAVAAELATIPQCRVRHPRRSAQRKSAAEGGLRPSAGSGELLCERLVARAAVMVAEPARQLVSGEHAVRLDHGPLAVGPAGLDRVAPR